jgi:hypothetical protein
MFQLEIEVFNLGATAGVQQSGKQNLVDKK